MLLHKHEACSKHYWLWWMCKDQENFGKPCYYFQLILSKVLDETVSFWPFCTYIVVISLWNLPGWLHILVDLLMKQALLCRVFHIFVMSNMHACVYISEIKVLLWSAQQHVELKMSLIFVLKRTKKSCANMLFHIVTKLLD